MLGLTTKPLAIVVAVLVSTQAASAWYIARLHKEIGACQAQCELRVSNESANRSQATNDLATKSLRAKIEALEAELVALRALHKAVQLRHTESQELLNEYRKQLDAARKNNPDLDRPVDTSRLRNLEAAYRVRADARRDGAVQVDPTSPAETPLQ